MLSIYQSFHHLLQLQWSGNKRLENTGFQPVQQAPGRQWQKPSPKHVQLPITQTNSAEKGQPTCLLCEPYTHGFSHHKEPQTLLTSF